MPARRGAQGAAGHAGRVIRRPAGAPCRPTPPSWAFSIGGAIEDSGLWALGSGLWRSCFQRVLSAPDGRGTGSRRRAPGLLALDERGVHHARRAELLPHVPPHPAARLPRLQGPRSVRLLRQPARPAPARQRRRLRAAGAHVDRAAGRLEAPAAAARAGLRAHAGEPRVPRRAPRRRRQAGGRPARGAQRRPPSRRCRCSTPASSCRRGASCCPTTATPRCAAYRSTCRSPASTSSRR